MIEIVKPYLKYILSIDYGKITYYDDFVKLLESANLKTTYFKKCDRTLILKNLDFYIIEAVPEK